MDDNLFFNPTTFGEARHRQAAHDLPLLAILIDYHTVLIPSIYPGTELARTATEANCLVEKLLGLMQDQAKREHRGADFIKNYSLKVENFPDAKVYYPPSIELKDKVLTGIDRGEV
jgi:hypothetical protein